MTTQIFLPFENVCTAGSFAVVALLILAIQASQAAIHPSLVRLGQKAWALDDRCASKRRSPETLEIFATTTFRLLFRSLVTTLGIYEFIQSPQWWYNTDLLWEGYPNHPVSNVAQCIYLLQLAYHINDLYTISRDIVWGLPVRKDFVETTVHHVATVSLLIGSSYYNFTRVGCVVSTLHGFADIPKDMAKSANQLGWKFITRVCFAGLVLTWAYTRLYLFPCFYLRSTIETSLHDNMLGSQERRALQLLALLLTMLLLLNLMWFGLIIKVLINMAVKGKNEDPTAAKTEVRRST